MDWVLALLTSAASAYLCSAQPAQLSVAGMASLNVLLLFKILFCL